MNPFLLMMIKFCYSLAVIFILIRFFYYSNKGKKEYIFTCILLSAIIFYICILISHVDLSLGFAIGIFAIFGVIRYRTIPISPREMTYIFLCVGIAAKNALVPSNLEFYKLFSTDLSILLLAGISEYFLFRKKRSTKMMVYNNLELIHPDRREELYKELNEKYGISEIYKIQVGKIDTIKNSARLLIHFKDIESDNFEDE